MVLIIFAYEMNLQFTWHEYQQCATTTKCVKYVNNATRHRNKEKKKKNELTLSYV